MTARSERDRESATCVRKEEGKRVKQFHATLVGIIGASLFETFFSNFEMVKEVGCDLCMLKITKTRDFVAKNFEIKIFFEFFVMKSTKVSVRGRARPQRVVAKRRNIKL